MSHKFPEYDNLQLSGVNKKVLDQWQEEDLFARTLALREGAPSFVFYEGPPTATSCIVFVDADLLADIFLRDAEGLLDPELYGQTVGIPAGLAVDAESLHRLVETEDILDL